MIGASGNNYLYDRSEGEIFINPSTFDDSYNGKIHLKQSLISHIFLDYNSGYLIVKGVLPLGDEESSYEIMKLSHLVDLKKESKEQTRLISIIVREEDHTIKKLNFNGILISYAEILLEEDRTHKNFEMIFYHD